MYPAATMETAQAATEDLYYSQLDATRTALLSDYPTDNTTNPNASVAKVGGADGENKIGPGITLKVMAGDQFNIRVSSWYHLNGVTPANGTITTPLTDLVTGLIAGVGGLSGGGLHATPTQLQGISSSIIEPEATKFLDQQQDSANTTLPEAYLNWVLFDNQMNYVASSSGFEQVGGSDTLKQMIQNNLPVGKNGYLYIYVRSKANNVDVFFDNLQVTVIRGHLPRKIIIIRLG